MLAFHCLCWLLLQCILILVMFLFSHCLCWVVINLIFDFNISLFMFTVCTTIINYFDCSRVSIEFLCLHICMSLSSLLVWRTKVDTRTGGWWMSLESERKDAKFVFCHSVWISAGISGILWRRKRWQDLGESEIQVPGPIAVDEGRPSPTLLRERQTVLLTGRASTIATNNGGQNPRFQTPSVLVNLKPLFPKKNSLKVRRNSRQTRIFTIENNSSDYMQEQ